MTALVAYENVNVDQLDGTAFIGVVTGATTANSSIDGITFTARSLATSTAWTGVAANGKTAVAVASGNRTVNTSPDGITWTAQALALPATDAWSGVVWGEADGLFVAVATTSTTSAASSPDGITWTGRTLPSAQNWLAVGYGNGSYVATSGASSTSFAYSTDGTAWNASTALGTAGDWRSVCWGDTGGSGTWVSVSYNSQNVAYSTDDGVSWTVAANLPSSANWRAVTYGNGRFVAVAFGSTKAAWSTDGITWNAAVLPTSLNWIAIAYNVGLKRFATYAQTSASGCATSPDGEDWTTRTVVSASWTAVVASPIRWSSADTLTINNGATVTVNTNQTKFWKTITIADGKLRIENSSTTVPLVFAMGRSPSTATLNSIVPSNGLGTIEIAGNWIQIGTSDGSSNQTFDGKYREHIPHLEVETGSGTGIYEIYLNATGGYGDTLTYPVDGLAAVGSGARGKFFTQDAGTLPVNTFTLAGGVSTTNKYVTVTSTTGVYPGAAITGTGITANSVVDEVVSSTVLRLNLPTTASAGPNTYTVFNPVAEQFSSTVRFGNGTNGKIPPNGAKIRVPNICITDFTSANNLGSDRTLQAQFLMSGGGNLIADKCLFSESHLIATQAQTCQLTNCGFSLHPVISETYSLILTNVGMAIQPDRRYYASTAWSTRITRHAGSPSWSYIGNAAVTNLNMAVTQPQSFTGAAAATAVLNLSFTIGATFTNCRFYSIGTIKGLQYALYLSDTVLDCTFTDTEAYGCGVADLLRSNGNTFDGMISADSMFSTTYGFVTGQRVGSSALTDAPLVDDTKYYIKTRAYRDWTDLTRYHESRVYSVTPYLADDNFHPWNFGVVNTNTSTNVPTWIRRDPLAGTIGYEIYRDDTAGFTERNRKTRLFQTATAATVSMNDSGVYNAVASNGGTVFVAVGNNATVAMSGDGTATWTTRTAISGNWKAVAWNGTNFAAVGIAGAVSQTTTGAANWTTRTCISGNWQGIAAGPANQFCAVGNTDSYCMTSADSGVTWTQRICVPGDWKAIAWNGTVYAAVGNNGTTSMTSTDGITWTSRTIDAGNWNSIAWNGTYFVAVGNNGTTCTRSTDGITWGTQTITDGDWRSVAVFGTTFCAVGHNTDGVLGYVTTSTDGATWTSIDLLGTELLTTAGWTVNAGWAESPDDTFTHTSGVNTLTHSATIVTTTLYRISWTIASRTTGSVTISVGGQTYSGITASGSWDVPAVTATTAFTITPTTGFDGVISATSLKVRSAFGWAAVAGGSARWAVVGAENTGVVTLNSTDGVAWNRSIGIAGAATNGTLPAPSNGETLYYVLRKYNSRIANPATNVGSTGAYTVTTNQNYNAIATQAVVNCRGITGTPIVRAVGANFDSLGIVAGMKVSGTGVTAGTTVVSVDSYYQITLSANLTSTLYDSTMTFGLVAGMYVFGTGIGQNARISTIDSDTQITLDVPHESDVSGILNFSVATESAEQEVRCDGWAVQRTNLCLQSNDFTNASWTKTSVSATTNVALAPNEVYFVAGTTLTITADRLAATGASGTVTQSITTIVGAEYTFSVYIIANNATPQTLNSGSIGLGSATTAWTASQLWQRISVTFTAIATSTTATITITTNGAVILAAGAQIELGGTATPPIPTTTTAVTAGGTEISALQVWSKRSGGATANQGFTAAFAASSAPLWTEFFMGTTSNFTPSVLNRIATTIPAAVTKFLINTSNTNTFDGLTQLGSAGLPSSMVSLTTSSDNKFLNFDWNVNHAFASAGQLLALSNLSNDNYLYNWNIKNVRNTISAMYAFGGTAGTTNNNSGLILQNLKLDTYEIPLNNNYLGTICKGVSGGSMAPATGSATTAVLGSAIDGVALAYTTIYDTIFNELYQGATNGSLYLTFNASNKVVKPYTILSGNPKFSNSGRLYFEVAGDSIEYEWPHKILGVTAFRSLGYKTSGVDIGNVLTTGFALKVEYAIKTTGAYGSYKEAIPSNLSTETLPDSATGFYLKIKLTVKTNMKYSGRTSKFVVGETINGLTSGATAVIDDDENGTAGTVGTLRLSSITGSWIPGETVRSGATNRATNVATNTSYALGPSFTSYIDGLEIYTSVDKTDVYPAESAPITITVVDKNNSPVQNAQVAVYTTTGDQIINGDTDALGVITATYSSSYPLNITYRVRKSSTGGTKYVSVSGPGTAISGTGFSATVVLLEDPINSA